MEAAGAYDVERRSVGEDPPQRAAVTALERALQRPGARQPLCLRLRAIGSLPVERERHAQPSLLPEVTWRDSPAPATVLNPQYVAASGTSESSTKYATSLSLKLLSLTP